MAAPSPSRTGVPQRGNRRIPCPPGTTNCFHGAEFRARIANTDAPPALVALRDERDDAQRRIDELTADVTALLETVHQLERIIRVLAVLTTQVVSPVGMAR